MNRGRKRSSVVAEAVLTYCAYSQYLERGATVTHSMHTLIVEVVHGAKAKAKEVGKRAREYDAGKQVVVDPAAR